jgi:hypothetical protein
MPGRSRDSSRRATVASSRSAADPSAAPSTARRTERRASSGARLEQQAGDVLFHRPWRQVQPVGDVLVRQMLADQLEGLLRPGRNPERSRSLASAASSQPRRRVAGAPAHSREPAPALKRIGLAVAGCRLLAAKSLLVAWLVRQRDERYRRGPRGAPCGGTPREAVQERARSRAPSALDSSLPSAHGS